MGFLDICKSVVGYFNEQAEKMQGEFDRYKERYESESDEHLLSIVKSATGMRKVAIAAILRDRGYGANNEE